MSKRPSLLGWRVQGRVSLEIPTGRGLYGTVWGKDTITNSGIIVGPCHHLVRLQAGYSTCEGGKIITARYRQGQLERLSVFCRNTSPPAPLNRNDTRRRHPQTRTTVPPPSPRRERPPPAASDKRTSIVLEKASLRNRQNTSATLRSHPDGKWPRIWRIRRPAYLESVGEELSNKQVEHRMLPLLPRGYHRRGTRSCNI